MPGRPAWRCWISGCLSGPLIYGTAEWMTHRIPEWSRHCLVEADTSVCVWLRTNTKIQPRTETIEPSAKQGPQIQEQPVRSGTDLTSLLILLFLMMFLLFLGRRLRSVVSNRIGMKFGRIVCQRLAESDTRFEVKLSRRRSDVISHRKVLPLGEWTSSVPMPMQQRSAMHFLVWPLLYCSNKSRVSHASARDCAKKLLCVKIQMQMAMAKFRIIFFFISFAAKRNKST